MPSHFVEQNLDPGETIGYRGHVSWIAALHRGVIMFVIAIVLFVIAASNTQTDGDGHIIANPALSVLGFFALVGSILSLVSGFLFQRTSEYAVTDRRVIGKYGLIRQRSVDVLMTAISGASTSNTVLGRMFGYGNVWVKGSGTSQVLINLADPHDFQSAVHKRLEDSRLLKGTAAYVLDVRVAPDDSQLSPESISPSEAAPIAATSMRFCTQCGKLLTADARFCPRCGFAAATGT